MESKPGQNLQLVTEVRPLSALKMLSTNAHYMDKTEFDILVANIRRDGVLTSYPVIYDRDVRGEILSGNHRVKAALQAGLTETPCIVIKSPLTHDQKLGIILSHNAIHGKDDETILRQLFEQIESVDFKKYSGLTEDDFKLEEVDFKAMSFEQPQIVESVIKFMPADKACFEQTVADIEKKYKKKTLYLAHIADYGRLFDTVLKIKTDYGIINVSTAMKKLCDLAQTQMRLEEEADEAAGDAADAAAEPTVTPGDVAHG